MSGLEMLDKMAGHDLPEADSIAINANDRVEWRMCVMTSLFNLSGGSCGMRRERTVASEVWRAPAAVLNFW